MCLKSDSLFWFVISSELCINLRGAWIISLITLQSWRVAEILSQMYSLLLLMPFKCDNFTVKIYVRVKSSILLHHWVRIRACLLFHTMGDFRICHNRYIFFYLVFLVWKINAFRLCKLQEMCCFDIASQGQFPQNETEKIAKLTSARKRLKLQSLSLWSKHSGIVLDRGFYFKLITYSLYPAEIISENYESATAHVFEIAP